MIYREATPEDNDGICTLLREVVMPGEIEIAYCRDPDYFVGVAPMGEVTDTLLAIVNDEVKGIATRSERTVYINGKVQKIGYVGSLRLHPSIQKSLCFFKGYALCKKKHEASGAVQAYLTSIIDGNREAIEILTSERAGLPHFEYLGNLHSYSIMINHKKQTLIGHSGDIDIKSGVEVPLQKILSFLATQAQKYNYFPTITETDFSNGRLRGLHLSDFLIAQKDGEIIGTIAGWDQSAYKQTVITAYKGKMKWLKPFINLLLKCKGAYPLPKEGGELPILYGSFFTVKDDDSLVGEQLIRALYSKYQESGKHSILIGLHEKSPLQKCLASFKPILYKSCLYLSYWEDGETFAQSIDHSLPIHVEVATL